MDVTPQLLHDVEFREAKRGYNTQDVDDFLERLAVGLDRQEAQVREMRQRLEAADARIAEAERRASEAESRAADTSESDETLKRTLVLAQRTADAAIREAEEEAARTLSSARQESERMIAEAQDIATRAREEAEAEARRAQADARAQVTAEMKELEAARGALQADVAALESHLDEQRERIRHSVSVLQDLLDNPDALRSTPAPDLSEVPEIEEEPAPLAPPAREPLVAADEEGADDPAAWIPDDDIWSDEGPDGDEDLDTGPPTQPVDVLAERPADDDDYLAELRKAMTDDEPLGPRDEPGSDALFSDDESRPRSRFGRRR